MVAVMPRGKTLIKNTPHGLGEMVQGGGVVVRSLKPC